MFWIDVAKYFISFSSKSSWKKPGTNAEFDWFCIGLGAPKRKWTSLSVHFPVAVPFDMLLSGRDGRSSSNSAVFCGVSAKSLDANLLGPFGPEASTADPPLGGLAHLPFPCPLKELIAIRQFSVGTRL